MHKLRILILGTVVGLAIGGCAVKPKPFTQAERSEQITKDLDAMFGEPQSTEEPINLYEAMARAIKYNLDHRVQLMEDALRRGELAAARADLLPQLTASAGYSGRSNANASTSITVLNNIPSREPSRSTDNNLFYGDISLVWNILDFGVSYATAKQQADQILISQEKRRKVVQNIIQDVRYAFWRAASAEQLLPKMDELLLQAEGALDRVSVLEQMRLQDPNELLEYRKQLLQLIREMWTMRRELGTARAELAALINLRPGQEIKISAPNLAELGPPILDTRIDRLEAFALSNRPELREEQYQARISQLEVRKALLRMLPGLELSLTGNYDSNSFLANQAWATVGTRVTWNIFNLFTGPRRVEVAKSALALDEARRLSLNIAVLTQVHLATIRYQIASKDYHIAYQLLQVENQLQENTESAQEADQKNELEVLRSQVQALTASLNQALSYAELQNAYGRIHNSIGLDPLPTEIEHDDVESLTQYIRDNLVTWEDKVIPPRQPEPEEEPAPVEETPETSQPTEANETTGPTASNESESTPSEESVEQVVNDPQEAPASSGEAQNSFILPVSDEPVPVSTDAKEAENLPNSAPEEPEKAALSRPDEALEPEIFTPKSAETAS